MPRSASVIASLLLILVSASPTQADTVDVLSQNYSASARAFTSSGTLVDFNSASSSVSPVTATAAGPGTGTASAFTGGSIGPSGGFLSAGVRVLGGYGTANASASMDFFTTAPVSLSLISSGIRVPYTLNSSSVRLLNLTDDLVLLDFHQGIFDGSIFDLTGSFTFHLDALKTYRLAADAYVFSPDAASARVNYTVPEPTSFGLLLAGLAALGIARKKVRKQQ